VRADRSAGAQGVFPAGLERGLELVAHPGRDVSIEPAHANVLRELTAVYDKLPGDIQADLPLQRIWSLADGEETE
jgi:hypothetical protein